jgi:hypothetical protein
VTDDQYKQDPAKYFALGYTHYNCSCDSSPSPSSAGLDPFESAGYWFVGCGEILFNGNFSTGAKDLAYAYASDFLFGAVLSAGISGLGSVLEEASDAAKVAAAKIDDFHVPLKHLPSAGGNWAKFANDVDAKAAVSDALKSLNATFRPNGADSGSFVVVTDLGKQVGEKGETSVKVVVTYSGKIITAYPVNSR